MSNRAVSKTAHGEAVRAPIYGSPIQRFVKHTQFAVYPQLKDLRIEVGNVLGNAHYESNGKNKRIVLSQHLVGAARMAGMEGERSKVIQKIIHEIQHAIQEIEGFTGGANPTSIKKLLIKEGKLDKSVSNIPYGKLDKEDRQKVYQEYIRFAGESEARDTQQKTGLTEEELTSAPFLPEEKNYSR